MKKVHVPKKDDTVVVHDEVGRVEKTGKIEKITDTTLSVVWGDGTMTDVPVDEITPAGWSWTGYMK